MTTLRKKIKEIVKGWPNGQISAGLNVDKVGVKYVHVINSWQGGKNFKMTLDDFYHYYILCDRDISFDSYIF
jgi:hypothetical protein